MLLGSCETERRLREAALKRIRRSPRLMRAYRQDRPPAGWLRRALGCLFSTIMLVVLLPLVLAAMLVPWLGPAVFLGWAAGQGGAAMDFILALASLVGVIVAWLLGCRLVSGLRRSRELAILAHLPISDRDIVRAFQCDFLGPGPLFLLPCVLFYATFALRQALPAVSFIGAAGLGPLELASVLALAALLAALLPSRLEVLGFLAVVVGLSTVLAMVVMDLCNLAIPAPWPGVGPALKLLLPTGWVNAVLQYGLVEGEPAAWLMLLPAGLLLLSLPAALERLRSAYRVREIRLVDETAEAVFEDESLWKGWFYPTFLGAADRSAATAEIHQPCEPLDRQTARQRVLSREFLDGWNWNEQGWEERTIASLLTRRQRDILEFLLARPPEWSRVLTVVLASVFPVLAIEFFLTPPALFSCVVSAGIVLAGALVATSRTTWTSADHLCSPAFVQVPIGYGEIVRSIMVAATARALLLVPIAILAGALFFFVRGLDPLQGAMLGVRSTLVVAAIHYWSFLSFRRNVTSHGPSLTDLIQTAAYPLLALFFGASAVVLLIPGVGEPWNTLAAGGMFGGGWLVSRYDEWRFNRGTYDLIARPASDNEGA